MKNTGHSEHRSRDLEYGTQGTDWENIQRRVAQASRALGHGDEASPQSVQQILERRAERLAGVLEREDEGEQIELVLVRLGREVYGLDARYVDRIGPAEHITPVPRVPEWVAGVVNVRGRIFSAIDLRRFFGLPASERKDAQNRTGSRHGSHGAGGPASQAGQPTEAATCLVVVEMPDMELALLVDDALGVEALPASRVREASGTVRGLRPEYVQGVIEWNGSDGRGNGAGATVTVLDLAALLADERLVIHEEIT